MINGWKWGSLSKKQKFVLNWWTEKSPYHDYDGIIADGAIRSGKTVSMAFSYVMWAMENFNGMNFGMCGKTIASFRRNVLTVLKMQLRTRGYYIRDNKSENLVVIRKGDKENNFYIFGGKDEASQDLIQGITLAGIFFDEVALMPESFVNQGTARCSVDGSKFWFNCNPAGPFHYFKKNWIDKCRSKRLVYLHFTMADNLTLTDKIRKRYASQYVGVFFQRYILGLWVAAEGLIYDMFDKAKHVTDTAQISREGEYFVSCDYGTQNATVFLLWHKESGSERWCLVKEYYYSGRDNNKQKTDSELADDLEKWLGDIREEKVIVDPAAASFITELRKRGHSVKKADNEVRNGISDVSTMLYKGNILIDKSCKHMIEEFASYCWDEKKAEKGEDAPVKVNDHCCDALRYFIKTMKLVKKDFTGKEYNQGNYVSIL